MPTFTLSGFQVNRAAPVGGATDGVVTAVSAVDLQIVVPAGQETFTYSVLETFPDGIPEVDINASDVSVTASGTGIPAPGGTASLPEDSLTFLGFIESSEGVHTILSVEVEDDDGSRIELIFQIGGAALTSPTSVAEFNALEASVDSIANFGEATGAFAPGATIDFNTLDNTVRDAAPAITGTEGDDSLTGTNNDDTIATGNATPNGDTVVGSTGNDTIEMWGNDGANGFVTLDYRGMAGPLTVDIDGGANTGSVVKGTDGTDTLLGVVQPLAAGWTNGGLAVLGTGAGDTFNLAPEGEQWMSVRGGDGADSYAINGTGLVRLDFRDGTGLDINLATGVIADDGFGNAETISGTGAVWEVWGSGGDDSFVGSAGGESYRYGGGNNDLEGGLGIDRLRYDTGAVTSVNIDAGAGTVTGTLNGGGTFTDTISGFERLRGSNGNDTIAGEAGVDNRLEGRGGTDTFVHAGGNDVIADFDPANETLIVRVAGLDQTGFDSALNTSVSEISGVGVFVDFGGGNTVLFAGRTLAEMNGADVRFESVSASPVTGTDGDDVLPGTPGDDSITTGDATPNGDRVVGSTGNDIIDASGMNQSTAFLALDYGALAGPVTVDIDGAANTGSVDKGADGTDTLIDIENPLLAGNNEGGLGVTGTAGDDTFNLAPGTDQWMQVRGGDGADTFNISGNGFVRLDFRGAPQGIDVNLATGVIANDGFGNAETVTAGAVWEVRGTDQADDITGSASDESFILRGGDDTLDAGLGFDRLRYDRFGAGPIDADLGAGTVTGSWDGAAFTHSVSGVEWLRGSNADDSLAGDGNDNRLEGRGGTDTFVHVGGNDTISDFDPSTETLLVRVAGLDQTQVDDAISNATDTADGALVDFGSGSVLFSGVASADLSGADVRFDAPGGLNPVTGTDGDDTLVGTPGDDSITTGNATPNGDTVVGSTGDDVIDMSGNDGVNGFVSLDYSALAGPLTVDIDGDANTGSVVKGTDGTDTLVGVAQPLAAGFVNGGLGVTGTAGDDTFNLAPGTDQWMQVRGGDGADTFNISGNGFVRLDFRGAPQGIDVNLATGVIANDGFGNAETVTAGAVWEVRDTDQADDITGSASDESFILRGGDDTLDAGLGFDRLRYDRFGAGPIDADLGAGTVTGSWDGAAFTHSVSGVEWLRGSNADDSLAGDGNDNRLEGRGGTDTFVHVGGNDTISDFDPSTETLLVRVAGLDQTQVDDAISNATDTPDGALVTFGGGTVLFSGVAAADLSGADVRFDAPGGLNPVTGTDGDDVLPGTPGDDSITTGNATPSGDRVVGSTGNDVIDMSGNDGVNGFVSLDYSALAGPLTVDIDGGANTGSVVKGTEGTDTLVGVAQPLAAGWTNGGLAIVGTGADDTFNLTPEGQQWMSVRGGDGADSYAINGTGLVRLDFRDATQGIDVNLATGTIADDGFGNAESIGGTGDVWEVFGSEHDDTFTGSSDGESYRYFGGSNTLDGGLGFDRLRYDTFTVASVNIDAGAGTVTGTLTGGGTFTDTISGFERLRGSNGNDSLTGSAENEQFEGGGGNDTISGGGGDDTLAGGEGDATLNGGTGSDVFFVGNGRTVIEDFNAAEGDALDFSFTGLGLVGRNAALANAFDNGGETTVDLGGGRALIFGSLDVAEVQALADPDAGTPPPPPPTPIAWTVGDPHLLTLDGVGYDFHAIGEFVLLRGVSGGAFEGFEIQSRMGPVLDDLGDPVPNVSANIAIGARLGNGAEVMIDSADASPLSIGGVVTEIADGDAIEVGNDLIARDGAMYTVIFAGADGTVGAGDARLNVIVRDGFVDLSVQISADMGGQVEGLLGDGNGNPDDDIARADGTVLERPLAFEDLYGGFRDDWRVTTEEQSLFTYDAGETLEGFYDPTAPGGILTVDDFDQTAVDDARIAVEAAGLTPGTVAYENALIDFLLTEDETFIESSASETAPAPANTGSAGKLDAGETRITLDVSLADEAGDAIGGAVVNFSTGGAPILGQAASGTPGSYNIRLGSNSGEGRIDAVRAYDEDSDASIDVTDALNALRLAVGLSPSFGPANAGDFIAADVNADGQVSVTDALDILRFAVGLETPNAPRWVFVEDGELGQTLDKDNVDYQTGTDSGAFSGGESFALTGILLGNLAAEA